MKVIDIINLDNMNKDLLKNVMFGFLVGGIVSVVGMNIHNNLNGSEKELIQAFNEDKVLECGHLIVTNNNWKISQNHLINNNSAGYIDIKTCKIQKVK